MQTFIACHEKSAPSEIKNSYLVVSRTSLPKNCETFLSKYVSYTNYEADLSNRPSILSRFVRPSFLSTFAVDNIL